MPRQPKVTSTRSYQQGQSGTVLRWTDPNGMKVTYWLVDRDEAVALQQAMNAGASFETAHADLVAGRLDVDTVIRRRAGARARRLHKQRVWGAAGRKALRALKLGGYGTGRNHKNPKKEYPE